MIVVHIVAPTPALRSGLASLLQSPQLDVDGGSHVATLSDWIHSTSDIRDVQVLILADRNELGSLERVSDVSATTSLVLLTAEPADITRLVALSLRGWAALPVSASAGELQSAVIAASSGLVVMARELAHRVVPASTSAFAQTITSDVSLTTREQEVLEFVSRGLPNKTIAARLDLSESTIKFHLAGAFTKLGASSRAEAVSLAARQGLITL